MNGDGLVVCLFVC